MGLIVGWAWCNANPQLNGYLAERFGYRAVMIGSLTWLTAFIFLFFFANSLGMLCAAEVLCGIPWGILQTLTTTYASEVAPVALRGCEWYICTRLQSPHDLGQRLLGHWTDHLRRRLERSLG